MKRFLNIALALLLLSTLIPTALAADEPVSDAILAQAERILSMPLDGVPRLSNQNLFQASASLTGPFLYVGRADREGALYIPDISCSDYAPAGLPEGAAIYASDLDTATAQYPQMQEAEPSAPVVYALVLCTGYRNESEYQGGLTIYDQNFIALFVDFQSASILAVAEITQVRSTPYTLFSGDFFKDYNGRQVLHRDGATQLSNIWADALRHAVADETGAIIQGDTLVTIVNKQLEEYEVPVGVRKIGDDAFRGCEGLTTVTLPAGLEEIGEDAFWECRNLSEINLPNGLVKIGAGAFTGCICISELHFPDSLCTVGAAAFDGTSWMMSREDQPFVIVGDGVLIHVNVGVTVIPDELPQEVLDELLAAFGDLEDAPQEAVLEMLESYGVDVGGLAGACVIPEGVRTLGGMCLKNTSLTRLTLPSTLEGDWAQEDSLWFMEIQEIVLSEGITTLPDDALSNCRGVRRVYLPATLKEYDIKGLPYELDLVRHQPICMLVCPENSDIYAAMKDSGYVVEVWK